MNSGHTPSVQDYFQTLKLPDTEQMKIQLEELVQQGTLSPEEAQTILLGESQMNNINLDPKLQQAQMSALSDLQNIGAQGGLTIGDRAKLNQIQTQEDTANRGKREAILQNMQARGMGGSGIELAAQLQNQQDSAMRQSQRDMDVAALAEQRALDAILQSGNLAGNISNQQFGQQAQVAQANDAISQFNAQNQQNQINMNVANRNAAQAANMGLRQDIANQNVGMRNQAQQYNKSMAQQNFQNELAKRGGQAGIANQNAQIAGQNSQNKANANNQMIGMGAGLASAGIGYMGANQLAQAQMAANQQRMQQPMQQNTAYQPITVSSDFEKKYPGYY